MHSFTQEKDAWGIKHDITYGSHGRYYHNFLKLKAVMDAARRNFPNNKDIESYIYSSYIKIGYALPDTSEDSPSWEPCTNGVSNKILELYAEEVESVLNKSGVDVAAAKKIGPPLCQASIDGKIELVRDLLIRGHDVNQGDLADRCTPLMRASQKGHTEVVQLLLENQANVNQSNRFGSAPLHMASEKGYTDVVRRLVNANGVDVNQSDHHGLTPLLMASDKGHTEVVRLLVNAYGVDVNKSNKNAATPLLIAIKKGYTEIVRLLVHAQALLDQPDKKGNTPFSVAFDNRHGEVVNLLLEKDPTLLNQVCVTQEQIDNAAGRAEKHVLKRRRQYYRGIEDVSDIESGSDIESDSESGPGSTDTESNSESGPGSTEVEKDGKSQPAEANSDVVVIGSSYPKTDSDLESCAGTLVVSDSDSGTLVVSDSGSGTPVVSDTDECTEKSPESVQDRITGVEEDLVEEDSSDGKPQRIQSHERTDKSPDSVQDSRVLTDTSSANKQLFPQDVTSSTNHQVRRSSRQHIKFNNRRDIDTYGEKESGQMKAFRWHIYDYSLKKSREMLMGHFSPNTCEALKITLRNIHASPTGEPGHGLLFQQIKLSEKDEEIIFKALPFPCIAYYVFLKHLIAKIPPIEIDEELYSFDFSTWKRVLKSQTKRPGNIHTHTVDDQESVDNEVYDSLREYGKYSGKPQGTDGLTTFAFPSYSKCICDARKKVFKKLDRSSRLDFCEQQIFGGSLGLDKIYHKGVKEFIRYFELSICLLASEPSFSTATDEE
jgi:ankyrin repeat protein